MTFNPLEHRGIPLDEQVRNWSELDVEPVDAIAGDPLVELGSAFSAAEIGAIERQPEHLRLRVALRLWTRKEAALKATGYGFEVAPAAVQVTGTDFDPDDRAIFLEEAQLKVPAIAIAGLDPRPDHVAACALVTEPELEPLKVRAADGAELLARRSDAPR